MVDRNTARTDLSFGTPSRPDRGPALFALLGPGLVIESVMLFAYRWYLLR